MLMVFVGREAIVRVEAMLVLEIRGGSVLAGARLGVGSIFVVRPEPVDDEAVARPRRTLRRRRLLTAEIAKAGSPRQRQHIIVEQLARDGRSGLRSLREGHSRRGARGEG